MAPKEAQGQQDKDTCLPMLSPMVIITTMLMRDAASHGNGGDDDDDDHDDADYIMNTLLPHKKPQNPKPEKPSSQQSPNTANLRACRPSDFCKGKTFVSCGHGFGV